MTSPRKRSSWPLILALAFLASVGWAGFSLTGGAADVDHSIAGATAIRGSLTISVIERGNLEAADSVTLKSELEGTSTVLYLIAEGTNVEPGELLCELDNSSLVDRKVSQEIRVQNAEAAFVKAKQTHAIQVSQNESDIAKSIQELEFARLDIEKYIEGDMPQEAKSKEEAILLADEELSKAVQDLEWSKRLNEQGFLEQTQLDTHKLVKSRADVKLSQAKRAKQLFEDYEIPRSKKELEGLVAETERELDRVKLQAGARLADFDANWRTTEATLLVERNELTKLISQIEKSRITAPMAGMVVYARPRDGRWGGGEPMQEGSTVRERQDIITIPSSNGFIAEASLHESVLEQVQIDMHCLVTVDALHEAFPGEVMFKAVLPDQNSWFANPEVRVYKTKIRVLSQDPRIRPGMSCSIEIFVDEIEDAVQVPVQAIFLDAGSPIVFASQASGFEKRAVTVGQNNGKWVEVLSGVSSGDVVAMAPPPGLELRPSDERPARAESDAAPETPDSQQGGGDRGDWGDTEGRGGKRDRSGGDGNTARGEHSGMGGGGQWTGRSSSGDGEREGGHESDGSESDESSAESGT
jgi:HlyD family secretion protein